MLGKCFLTRAAQESRAADMADYSLRLVLVVLVEIKLQCSDYTTVPIKYLVPGLCPEAQSQWSNQESGGAICNGQVELQRYNLWYIKLNRL